MRYFYLKVNNAGMLLQSGEPFSLLFLQSIYNVIVQICVIMLQHC